MADWDPHEFTRNLIADMRAHGGVPTDGRSRVASS